MEEKSKNNWILLCAIILAVCGLVFTYGYVKQNISVYTTETPEDLGIVEEYQPLTVEEAVALYKNEKYTEECISLFYKLPVEIVQKLYEKLGTEKFITDYVEEFQNNKSYYYSEYYKSRIEEKIAGNSEVESLDIKANIKSQQEDTSKIKVNIPE